MRAENTTLKELVCEKEDDIQGQDRQYRQQLADLKTRNQALTKVNEEMSEGLEAKSIGLQETQTKLSTKEAEFGNLETEFLKVKAQTGDLDTLKILKKELSGEIHPSNRGFYLHTNNEIEQVTHIKTLEGTNRKQSQELKQLREYTKSIEMLEEEKEALEAKVRMMDDLRRENSEKQLRISILEDERNSWSSYFQSEGLEFDSPEALARALVQERVENAALLEKSGRTHPELTEKEETIQRLESELGSLRTELEKAKENMSKDSRARQRLERQRALALKEAQFLRDQLKSFSSEETMYMQGNFDEQKTKRIEELEELLETYKRQNETLEVSLADAIKREAAGGGEARKRSRENDDEDNRRAGELIRRNRQLQDGKEIRYWSQCLFFLVML